MTNHTRHDKYIRSVYDNMKTHLQTRGAEDEEQLLALSSGFSHRNSLIIGSMHTLVEAAFCFMTIFRSVLIRQEADGRGGFYCGTRMTAEDT